MFITTNYFLQVVTKKPKAIDAAEVKQDEFDKMFDILRAYPARRSEYIDLKESTSKNTKNFHDGWEKLFMGLKMEYYHFLKIMI